jgi:N2-citryl-N6-acetyl-N6-hydroxylysine synthase
MSRHLDLAVQHSSTSFLNSFLKEWKEHAIIETPIAIRSRTESSICIQIKVQDGEWLLPLNFKSALGRHRYASPFFFMNSSGVVTETGFKDLAPALAKLWSGNPSSFLKRLENSIANMALILENQRSESQSSNFLDTEQALALGHNFHPTPKSREGFTRDEFLRFSPETHGHFPLVWMLVEPSCLAFEKASSFQDHQALKTMLEQAISEVSPSAGERLGAGYLPFPMHPWQKERLVNHAEVKALIDRGLIFEVGLSSDSWHPTSSVRTVYSPNAPYMLKFSLSLKLTNSVRHLIEREAVRGLQVTDVLATEKGQKFLNDCKTFSLMREPAFVALKGSEGILAESIVVLRENPFQSSHQEKVGLLATLAQDSVFGEVTPLQTCVQKVATKFGLTIEDSAVLWLKKYFEHAMQPLIRAQSHYGLLFGAHQQNLLLKLEDGLPIGAYFRDCQGTGYTSLGQKLFGHLVPTLSEANGNILKGREGNDVFGYYLLLNSTFNLISALANLDSRLEKRLIETLRADLNELLHTNPPDPSWLHYVLKDRELMHKGNFACSVRELNENTVANPFSIYTPIPNVLTDVHAEVCVC